MHVRVTCHHLSKQVHRRINSGLSFFPNNRSAHTKDKCTLSPKCGFPGDGIAHIAARTDPYLKIDQLITFVREIFDSRCFHSKGCTWIKLSNQVFMTSMCARIKANRPEGREHRANIIYKDGTFIKGPSLVCVLNKYAITWRNIYSHSRNHINTHLHRSHSERFI